MEKEKEKEKRKKEKNTVQNKKRSGN